MGYVATGITAAQLRQSSTSGSRTAGAASTTSSAAGTPSCKQNFVWVPPSGGKAGYCARSTSTQDETRTVVDVRETPADAIRTTCGKWGFGTEKAAICDQWLRAGKPEAHLPSVFACIDKGYTGQSLELCIDGRLKGAAFDEIDTVINELAAQADAAQQAQLQQEQALVAARKRRTYLILGGLAAAGVVGFFVWKKRKGRKAKPSSTPTLTKA